MTAAAALCMALLLGACSLGAGRGTPGERVALVIGNARYVNAPPLVNPVNDADDVCAKLKDLGFTTTCLKNLRTRGEIDAAVRGYVEAVRNGGVGVLYYSGHGVQAGGSNFLIPTEADAGAGSDPRRALYSLDEVFEHMRRKNPRYQLVVLDACRTDLFAAAALASARSVARALLVRQVPAAPLASVQNAPVDTMVLYATGSGEAAYDGDGRNGPLTKHVLRHIGTRGIDQAEFINRVTLAVANETERAYQRRQTPFRYGSFSGQFCFAGCPGAIGPTPTN